MRNIAVVGAGYWGSNLIRIFNKLGVLKFVCDKYGNNLNVQASKFPHIKYAASFKKVLKYKEITALALATPAATHYTLAKEALFAQKHVFVEKPLSLKVKEARELIALAKKQNKVLMVGHILHYHPAVTKLKKLIDMGELGRIQYVYSTRLNIGKLRTEENVLWSFAPHDISCILMLLGLFPKRVTCFGGKYVRKQTYDTTTTFLDFPGGIKAHIFVSWLHPFKEQKLIVVGTKKMAVFDDLRNDKLCLYPHKIHWNNHIPTAIKANPETITIDRTEPLMAECKHFIDCVTKKTMPRTDGKEGLRVLRILSAASQSLAHKGNAIQINEN